MAEKVSVFKKTRATEDIDEGIPELVGFLIGVNKITTRLQAAVTQPDLDVTMSDWILLRAITNDNPLSMADLARKIGVSRQRVQKQATILQTVGLVKTSGAAELKARQLSLTKAGNTVVERIEKSIGEALPIQGELTAKRIHGARMAAMRLAREFSAKGAKGKGAD